MLDTRRHLRGFYKKGYHLPFKFIFSAFGLSFILAFCISFIPEYPISTQANYTMFIMLFATGLWISEAIPAFAVSLLVIALEIMLLGFNDFDFALIRVNGNIIYLLGLLLLFFYFWLGLLWH